MIQVIKQTKQERYDMYMQHTKLELISMIKERLKYDDILTKESLASVLSVWEEYWAPEACAKEEHETNESLQKKWKDVSNYYLKKFCDKHEYVYDPTSWIGDNPGTLCEICDMFVGMEEMRYDIDHNIPEDKFEKWYWKGVELHELDIPYMNYNSYCLGAPDVYTDERMEELRKANERVRQAKIDLENTINELKKL